MKRISLIFILLLYSCADSGIWEDDPGNWERAFGSPPSEGIIVKHSWYWRSLHIFFEYEYFFEVQHTERLEKSFLSFEDLVKVSESEIENIHFFNEKPMWFLPHSMSNYEIWRSTTHPNYYLFIDRKNKSIFFTEYQV